MAVRFSRFVACVVHWSHIVASVGRPCAPVHNAQPPTRAAAPIHGRRMRAALPITKQYFASLFLHRTIIHTPSAAITAGFVRSVIGSAPYNKLVH